jgi:hypothetical protein
MPERYPADTVLLNIAQDPSTGVEYVPTGKTPYFLEFRRLIQRLLLASERANDFRVYQDGDLSIGIRPGKAFIDGAPIDFPGIGGISVNTDETAYVWIDEVGTPQLSPSGFPSDRTRTIPLGIIGSGTTAIESVTDHRGEAFMNQASLNSLGLTTSVPSLHPGSISASVTGQLAGVVPSGGTVIDVVLSLGGNIVSDNSADGITVAAKVNGVALTSTDPGISSSDGAGFASTDQGAGVPAVVKSDGSEQVSRGDILTIDLIRSASGIVSNEATDAVAMVVIQPS